MDNYIYHSPLAPVDIPQVPVTEYVLRKALERPDHLAIIDGTTGSSMTFAQLSSRTRRVAGGLQARGFEPGGVLALVAPNCPDYAVVFHAVALCGGTVTTVNPTYGIAELRQQLLDSNASWIVADKSCMAVARQAMRSTNVTDLAGMQNDIPGLCIDDLLADEIDQVGVDVHKHPVVLPYSSGTTGLPKGVMLSHHNLVANLVQLNDAMRYEHDEVGLAVLPFFHIFGMQALMGSLLSEGFPIVTMPRFDMAKALHLIQEHSVTQFFVVPPIVLGLAKSPIVDDYNVQSLRKIVSGAAPLGSELCDEAERRIGCPIVQAYGMTELSPACHATPGFDSKPGSSGITLANTQSRIVDANNNDLPPEQVGELLVKGPQVMMGYLNNKKATIDSIDKDGWLHTGDLARFDNDGYMSVVDRVKELIKFKGFQIAPAELEAVIITHPEVNDVAVIGTPDDEAGEVPKAFVVFNGDISELDENSIMRKSEEIKALVSKQLANYKSIHEVQWINAIPKSASGKILRRVLKSEHALA